MATLLTPVAAAAAASVGPAAVAETQEVKKKEKRKKNGLKVVQEESSYDTIITLQKYISMYATSTIYIYFFKTSGRV